MSILWYMLEIEYDWPTPLAANYEIGNILVESKFVTIRQCTARYVQRSVFHQPLMDSSNFSDNIVCTLRYVGIGFLVTYRLPRPSL